MRMATCRGSADASVQGPGVPWAELGWDASHLAETLVVKVAHSLAYTSLVVPVISSHWAWSVPPATGPESGLGDIFQNIDAELAKTVRAECAKAETGTSDEALSTSVLPS